MKESPSRAAHTHSRRRRSSSGSANSPEFEFWRLGPNNPLSFPQPELHSADELFSDGFLLPLHLLHLDNHQQQQQQPPSDLDPDPTPDQDPELGPTHDDSASASITSSNPILTASKRWREIFKRGDKKPTANPDEVTVPKREKSGKKRDKKNAGNNGGGNSSNNNGGNSNPAELNINIWPFSRSRSAGNNSGRARPSGRKVSSAPCSRSNSSGESKSRRTSWPNSPGRAGVHLGRASPVWQLRRNRAAHDGKPAGKGRVLNLNVPMCIGYRQQTSCRIDESGGVGDGDGGGGGAVRSGGAGGTNGNLFGFRGLFSKKSVLTV